MVDVLGTQLGRYDIRERLGQGGMAAVYKAWDANLDRWVAVKVLHDHLAGEPALKERFKREAKVVAKLNHPNIVQVYDFGLVERNSLPIYYMVMPYMPGPSLRDITDQKRIRGERFTLAEIDNIIRGVCGALAYAHAQGMIHRDVKPGNILFDEKIGGSFHMALGAGYPETGSKNKSAIHWDMICDLRQDSEILVDNQPFYKNGEFVFKK